MDYKKEYNDYLHRINEAVNNGDIERKELKILTEEEYIKEFGQGEKV